MRFGTLIKTLSAAAFMAAALRQPKPKKPDRSTRKAGPSPALWATTTSAAQRGLYIYQTRCQARHSLGLVRFSSLADLGWELLEGQTGEDVAKAIASNYEIPYINDDGENDTRPGVLNDTFPWALGNPGAPRPRTARHRQTCPPWRARASAGPTTSTRC